MARMRACDAAVLILEKEGATQTFGVPGAAINPFHSAMRAHGDSATSWPATSRVPRTWRRGIPVPPPATSASASGPAGTDMITGLYSASADSIPILAITGQAPVARLHKEDF